jgi:hypothetical protein
LFEQEAALDTEAIEIVLGHFFVAFGQGSGRIRFTSDAVVAARRLCLPLATQVVNDWETYRAEVLEVVAAMGRVAAGLVTDDGRVDITAEDVRHAIERVVSGRSSFICLQMRKICDGSGI